MSVLRPLLLLLSALPCFAATFGTVVPHTPALADLVIDEARKRLYAVNTISSTVEVYSTTTNPPRLTNSIKTDATPLSLALSPEKLPAQPHYLYVTCYDGSTLDIIDLSSASFSSVSKQLDAKPEGVAVGFNGLVLITTVGTGTGAEVLIAYDPASGKTQGLAVAPTAPLAPALPATNNNMYLVSKSRLQASLDGKVIVGVNLQAASRTVFVFDVASSIVLRSRVIPVISPILAVSPDGSRFLSGPMLFDTQTLAVLAQQNTTKSPYVFPATANFNVQTSQGGAAFLPDGSALLAAYNIVPTSVPAMSTNASQMTVNTPETMLIQLGIKLPENLGGKMAITSDGATAYAISQSGFIVLPIGTLKSQPIGMPDSTVALLASDQCGVTAAQNAATIPVRTSGGRITVTAQAFTSTSTSPTVRASSKTYGGDVTVQFSATAARTLGTAASDQLLIQATEAVNIIPAVRVFQNTRNAEATGTILPIDWGASATGLTDMLDDTARQRLYIANPGLNRLEVFDMRKRAFLNPIPVSQLPRSMALGSDGNTLYVASGGGEQISIVDLTQGAVTGRVLFPPLPFNASFSLITPSILASSQRGVQVIMSDGTLWKIVGDQVTPRTLNTNIFGTARSIPAPQTMAPTPDGSYVLILGGTGTAFLYSAATDDFAAAQTVIPTPITGYYGPIAAGPGGQYYLVNDQVLNPALTPIGSSGTGATGGGALPSPSGPTSSSGRPVAAVTPAGASSYARFSIPVTAANATPSDTGLVEVVDVNTSRTLASAGALEIPSAVARSGSRVNVLGRSMALDSAGTTAFVLTASGLSVIPLAASDAKSAPQVPANGVVNTAGFQGTVAPGGLISIFGSNLATAATAASSPLPTVLGSACVTLNNSPLSLLATSATQINAQLPPTLAPGRYPLVVRSLGGQAASSSITVTVSKYAPAVFVDSQGTALFHADGRRVNKDHPGTRDEHLTLYATGLGVTTGGKVTAGMPSPASPLAVTAPVSLYFGNPLIKEAAIIVDWSGLLPGSIGVYQINCRIPGTHLNGDALPITVKIGGVSSPTTGNNVPQVWVR